MQNQITPDRSSNFIQQKCYSLPERSQFNLTPKFEHHSRGNFNNCHNGNSQLSNANFSPFRHTSPYTRENRSSYGRNRGSFQTHFHQSTNQKKSNASSIEEYFKPSMLEDPWQELEDRLKQKKKSRGVMP